MNSWGHAMTKVGFPLLSNVDWICIGLSYKLNSTKVYWVLIGCMYSFIAMYTYLQTQLATVWQLCCLAASASTKSDSDS